MAWAMSSLPVPDSPVISTEMSRTATFLTFSSTSFRPVEAPTMLSTRNSPSSSSRSERFSSMSWVCWSAFFTRYSSSSGSNGLVSMS